MSTEEKDLNYYLTTIRNIIYAENRWISIITIANKLGVLWNKNLLPNRSQSTITRLISLYLKGKGVNYKKTQYRDGYDTWVAPEHITRDLLPDSAWNMYEYRKRLEYNKRVADKNLQANPKDKFQLIVNNPHVKEYLKKLQKNSKCSICKNEFGVYNYQFKIIAENCQQECRYDAPMIYTDDFRVFVSPDCKTCSEENPQYFHECIKHCNLAHSEC